MRRQLGQSMVEYTIVCAALITALFFVDDTSCPGYKNCVSKLLTVMHDGYDGYSASISAIQKYGDYAADISGSSSSGSSSGSSNGGSSGSSGGISLNSDGLTEVSLVSSSLTNWGYLNDDGSVTDADGNIVGYYDDATGTITTTKGDVYSASVNTTIVDEEGNVLHLRAVTDCATNEVYGWAYVSKATGKVFNNVNRNEMDIGSLCTQAAFKVSKNGVEQGGRILNGEYYAAVYNVTISATPQTPSGEVIYWDFGSGGGSQCSVMVAGWDDGVGSDAERLTLLGDANYYLGDMDYTDYLEQTLIYSSAPTETNDCPSSRTITP